MRSPVGSFIILSIGAAGIVAMAQGCDEATKPTTVAALVIVPDTVRVGRGDSVRLTVSPVDDQGQSVPDVTPTFASSDTTLVRVSATGWVRSVGPVGAVLVTVSAQAVSRPIPTFVLALPRAVHLAPADTSIPQQSSFPLRASVVDGANEPVPGQTITYQSLTPGVVTVSAGGVAATAGPAGTARVVAHSGLLSDTATVAVVAVANIIAITPPAATVRQGDSVQFTAEVRDRNGDAMPAAPVLWTSSDTTVARVSGTGLARSVGPAGSTSIGAHSGAVANFAQVTVSDTNIVARVPFPAGASGIAISGNIVYLTLPPANRVARLDLATNTVTDTIPVGPLPAHITFNAAGTKAYVPHQSGGSVGTIDVATNTLTSSIAVSGAPLPVAISADGNTLFTTTDVDRLYKINLTTATVVDSIALPATSHHLLMHPNDTLLYVATRDGGSVLEVDWRSMAIVRTFTLGGQPQGMAMSLDRQELYVADEAQGVLRIVTLATGATPTPVALAGGGEGLALSADGTKLYVGLVFAGKVQVIDRVSRTILRTIFTGGTPREIVADAARSQVLVANHAGWVDLLR
jgi:YVTN family beta-propeller protein